MFNFLENENLKNILLISELSKLDIDEHNKIIILDSHSTSTPEKGERIKQLFLNNIEHPAEGNVHLINQQLLMLNSPLARAVLLSDEKIESLKKDKLNHLKKTIDVAAPIFFKGLKQKDESITHLGHHLLQVAEQPLQKKIRQALDLIELEKQNYISLTPENFADLFHWPIHLNKPQRKQFFDVILQILKNKNIPPLDLINFFSKIPISKLNNRFNLSPDKEHFIKIIEKFVTQYSHEDPSLLAYLLDPPCDVEDIREMIDSEHFIPMVHADRILAPGKIISKKFDSEIRDLLHNPSFVNIVKRVGVDNINKKAYHTWPKLYLKLAEHFPDHLGIAKLVGHAECMEVLNQFEQLNRTMIEHILSIAQYDELDPLSIILKWMHENKNYEKGKDLLDMGKAGYIKEAAKLLTRMKTDPTSAKFFEKADSTTAEEIHCYLTGKPYHNPKGNLRTLASIKTVLYRMKRFVAQNLQGNPNKLNPVEIELSAALSSVMIDVNGELYLPKREELEELLVELNIPLDSDYAVYLFESIEAFETNGNLSIILERIKLTKDENGPVHQMIRTMLNIPENEKITDQQAKQAALCTLLSRYRQIDVETCYGTTWTIATLSDPIYRQKTLKDLEKLFLDNGLAKKIVGRHAGIRTFPMIRPSKSPVLQENLLLESRDKVFSSMNAYVNNNLMILNGNLFVPKGIISGWIEQVEKTKGQKYNQIQVLNAMQTAFYKLACPYPHYDLPHPRTKVKGWWGFIYRGTHQPVLSPKDFTDLYKKIIAKGIDQLVEKDSASKESLEQLKAGLLNTIDHLPPDYFPEGYWANASGGNTNAIMAADLEVDQPLFPEYVFNPKITEDVITQLFQYVDTLPKSAKSRFSKYSSLIPLKVLSHSLNFKPQPTLQAQKAGKTSDDIIAHLKQPTPIDLSKIDDSSKKKWMAELLIVYPPNMRTRINEALRGWETKTWDELGPFLSDVLTKETPIPIVFPIQCYLESKLLELLTPEMRQQIPSFVVGDTNWLANQENVLLVCCKSPLTGQLGWFCRNRSHTSFVPFKHADINAGSWQIAQPLFTRLAS